MRFRLQFFCSFLFLFLIVVCEPVVYGQDSQDPDEEVLTLLYSTTSNIGTEVGPALRGWGLAGLCEEFENDSSKTYRDVANSVVLSLGISFVAFADYYGQYHEEFFQASEHLMRAVNRWCLGEEQDGDQEFDEALSILEEIYNDNS